MQKNSLLTTRQITMVAVLIAMAVVLKSLLSFETGNFRFTFYDIPMMVIGVLFGPIIGGITGVIVDTFHILISPNATTFGIFTLSNMTWAIIPGLFLFKKELLRSKLLFTIIIASIVAFVFNTIGIYQLFGTGAVIGSLPYRLAVLFVKLPIQFMFIEVIYQRVLMPMLLVPAKQKMS